MYLEHFDFTGQPFQLTPDPTFFFASIGHARAAAYLEYGLCRAEGFVVITGDVGAGKTTVLRDLLEQLDRSKIEPAHIASTQVNADDLLQLVGKSFGLGNDASNKATILGMIETHLTLLHAQGKRALLIVDEAQNLGSRAVEELRMLSNFQIGSKPLLQSFLIGQPEFRQLMRGNEMSQLRQRIIASYHLGPLQRNETEAYIKFRLTKVGWIDNPSFDADAFSQIHSASGGIPRRINALCDRLLLASYLDGNTRISATEVDAVQKELNQELESKLESDGVELNASTVSDSETTRELRGVGLRLRLIEARLELLGSTCMAIHRILTNVNKPPNPGERPNMKAV